ncbi:hypothetical protein M378DRAFT_173311, partial [Amanita muscaria Koide BX008]
WQLSDIGECSDSAPAPLMSIERLELALRMVAQQDKQAMARQSECNSANDIAPAPLMSAVEGLELALRMVVQKGKGLMGTIAEGAM